MKINLNFIPQNIALSNVKRMVICDSNGKKMGEVLLNTLSSDNLEKKLYTFGVLSDIHLPVETAKSDYMNALMFLNTKEKVDFICIAGDMGISGTSTEWNDYKTYTETYSPNTPVHISTGNHDVNGTVAFNSTVQYTGNPLYYSFTQGDDVFIMFGMQSWDSVPFSTESLQWLYETLETNRNKRVFLFEHMMRLDGCGNSHNLYPRDDMNNNNGKVFISLTEHYKNVLWFHGHSHTKFELQSILPSTIANYDRLFGCQSIHVPSTANPKDEYANYEYAGSQGYVVDVYKNGIHLRGLNFITQEFLPIASYWLDTTPINIQANSYIDPTGTINI